MSSETINTHTAVYLFHQLMQVNTPTRVLRIVGDGKMGKSHLLTKVFPVLAQKEHQATYAILDLRNRLYAVPDILHIACSQMSSKNFENYYVAHQDWTNRPKVKAEGVRSVFSSLSFTAKDSSDDTLARDRHLTTRFVYDLNRLSDKLLLLLFDSVSNASDSMQSWLMDYFLVEVSRLAHVRVIVAGRSLPDANGSYAAFCASYQLQPVLEEDEYISYCQKLDAQLAEQSIKDFAKACRYVPGSFADLVLPAFVKQRASNG